MVRPRARIRLTLLYAGAFAVTGTLLTVVLCLLTAQAVRDGGRPPVDVVGAERVELSSASCPGVGPEVRTDPAGDLRRTVEACADGRQRSVLTGLLVRTLPVVGVLALVLGHLMAGRVLAPLGRVTRAARRAAEATAGPRRSAQRSPGGRPQQVRGVPSADPSTAIRYRAPDEVPGGGVYR
ncbi:hypothetical protein [Streptomyces sp. WAC06614]|uniref:hypothetical protein n=1 Tax=Streptomyces sp. WAC06614 TaxID=2487416 RepID=UPI000F798421|nr:hypothetical protein [Streptomyces sp. WAC06614]RSS79142.1 hypothetical protein EF918_18355 [Streptomyces sp. WAC06614]